MNKLILMGRLTKEPEVRYTQGEKSTCVANFSLAVDRRYARSGQDETTADFFDCTAFGKLGEHVEKYYHKGTKILLCGRIQNNNYTNREGQKVYRMQVIAEELEFAESKSASQGQGAGQGQGMNQGGYQQPNYAPQGQGGYQNQGGYQQPNYAPQNQGSYQQPNYTPQGQGGYQQPNYAPQGQGQGTGQQVNGFMNIPDGIDEELPFT